MNNIIHTIRHTARAATVLLLALLTAQTAGATALTDFVTVSSQGTATARFAFSDHFYRVDWTGINTSQTTSVLLNYSSTWGRLVAERDGNTKSDITLYASASLDSWESSHITGLTPGQSSDGYTSYADLATGASDTTNPPVYKELTGGQTLCEVRLGVTNDGETDSRQSNKLTDTTAKRFSVTWIMGTGCLK